MHAYRTEAGICCVKFKVVVKIFFKSTKILAFIKKALIYREVQANLICYL